MGIYAPVWETMTLALAHSTGLEIPRSLLEDGWEPYGVDAQKHGKVFYLKRPTGKQVRVSGA